MCEIIKLTGAIKNTLYVYKQLLPICMNANKSQLSCGDNFFSGGGGRGIFEFAGGGGCSEPYFR